MNSTDWTSSIMDLKFNHQRKPYTADLKSTANQHILKILINLVSKSLSFLIWDDLT